MLQYIQPIVLKSEVCSRLWEILFPFGKNVSVQHLLLPKVFICRSALPVRQGMRARAGRVLRWFLLSFPLSVSLASGQHSLSHPHLSPPSPSLLCPLPHLCPSSSVSPTLPSIYIFAHISAHISTILPNSCSLLLKSALHPCPPPQSLPQSLSPITLSLLLLPISATVLPSLIYTFLSFLPHFCPLSFTCLPSLSLLPLLTGAPYP